MGIQHAPETQYTAVVSTLIDGRCATIVVEGVHDLESDEFNPLHYELIAMWLDLQDGSLTEIMEDEIATGFLSDAKWFLYVKYGDIVTAEAEAVTQTSLDAETLTVQADGRAVVFTIAGTVNVWNKDLADSDFYQIAIANPQQGEHLVLLLEVLGESPLEFRQVRLDDDELIKQIVSRYLQEIGVEDEGEEEE